VVRLTVEGETGCLEVEDDGIGMGVATRAGLGLGLEMMRSRARMIGGELEIRGAASGGTTIACRFPVEDVKTAAHLQ
jgi:signal transduction histidine kinase